MTWLPRQRVIGAQQQADQARIKLAETATKAPTAESQKLLYQTALGKLEAERRLAGQPPVNASDLKSVLNAIRTSKTLTSEEAQNAIGFAQANATPASQGTGSHGSASRDAEIPSDLYRRYANSAIDDDDEQRVTLTTFRPASKAVTCNLTSRCRSCRRRLHTGDILYNINHTRQAVQQLGTMDATQRAQFALALQSTDPKEAVSTFLHGTVGTAMSDQQKEAGDCGPPTHGERYDAAQPLAQWGRPQMTCGAQSSITLPGAKSPDTAYMLRQLDQFYQTVQRLHKGLPTIGRPGAGGITPTTTPPGPVNNNKKPLAR